MIIMAEDSPALTILYDNYRVEAALMTGWGFACLIKGLGKTILFDTGDSSPSLLHNMSALGVAPAQIDAVVLSHFHRDHCGGLSGFLENNSDVAVYLPDSFPGRFKDGIKAFHMVWAESRGRR